MAAGSGKHCRKCITRKALSQRLPDDETGEAWFIKKRWPTGVCCPTCGSLNAQTGRKHKTVPFRCREKACGKKFSTRHGTVMEGSKIGCQDWVTGMFLVSTSLKGASSVKLHLEFGVTQKTAWFMSTRIRTALGQGRDLFLGRVDADETHMGGEGRNTACASTTPSASWTSCATR